MCVFLLNTYAKVTAEEMHFSTLCDENRSHLPAIKLGLIGSINLPIIAGATSIDPGKRQQVA